MQESVDAIRTADSTRCGQQPGEESGVWRATGVVQTVCLVLVLEVAGFAADAQILEGGAAVAGIEMSAVDCAVGGDGGQVELGGLRSCCRAGGGQKAGGEGEDGLHCGWSWMRDGDGRRGG